MNWNRLSPYSMQCDNYKVSKSKVGDGFRYLLWKRDGNRWKLTEHDYFTNMADLEGAIK